MDHVFRSMVRTKGQFWEPSPDDDMEHVKHEPAFFQASLDFAYQNGGAITRRFLDALPPLARQTPAFLDSRVHMLMPGWWPCIPGWHHDDVERSRADGQPNYFTASYRPVFYMSLVGSADCATEFTIGSIGLPDVPEGEVYYREWHPLVDSAVRAGSLERWSCPFNTVVEFDDRDFHQGVVSKSSGWRWFGRVTVGNPLKPANEIRRNSMVYLERPMEGW